MIHTPQTITTRNGSVYLVTLVTVAAISSMVLIGVSLRTATNSKSSLIEQMVESNNTILDATEYAFQAIADDQAWMNTAQNGYAFNDFSLGSTAYTGAVIDIDTGALPTEITTNYRLKLSATTNTISTTAQIDLLSDQIDYAKMVDDLGAIFYWPLNETNNPANALDMLKDAQHGDYLTPSVAAGAINDQGAPVPLFNDANDHIEVPWNSEFKQRNGTISLWMNFTGSIRNENYSFIGMDFVADGVPTLNVSVYRYGIAAYVDDDQSWGFQNFAITPSDVITPGTWHHIAVRWGDEGLRVYIDGVLQGTNAFNRDGVSSNTGTGGRQPLRLGAGFYAGSHLTPEDGFEGSIAHVAYFDKDISSGKIAELAEVKPDLRTYSLVDDTWVQVFE